MKKRLVIFILFLTGQFLSFAQVQYNWEDERKLESSTTAEDQLPLYFVKMAVINNYYVEENAFMVENIQHRIIRVNNDEAIEKSNRIIINLGSSGKLEELKARTLLPNGKIVYFDQSELKDLSDEETGAGYKIFAIEGAVKGCEIEYLYRIKKESGFFSRQIFQFDVPVRESVYKVSLPKHLIFDFKSYNGYPEMTQSETEEVRIFEASVKDIPAFPDEEFAANDNDRMRVESKLSYNLAKGKSRMFTWADASKRIYSILEANDKADEKEVRNFLKKAGLKEGEPPLQTVLKVEDFIKNSVFYEENAPSATLPQIIKNRYADKYGMTSLFMKSLDLAGIEYQLVITSDNSEISVDPDFDSWNYLEDFLLFIPSTNTYIDPYYNNLRTGTISPGAQGNYGLFVELQKINDVVYPVGTMKRIKELPADGNQSNLDITVNFSDDFKTANVKMIQDKIGYEAYALKSAFQFVDEKRKQEILDEITRFVGSDIEIKKATASQLNDKVLEWHKPFQVSSDYTSTTLTEQAGPVVLFKVGELIGPQSELYQEKTRRGDVMNPYNRAYHRKIVVNIPDGYQIRNLDDLKMDVRVNEDGKDIYYFISTYKLSGNKLEIIIDEAYEKKHFPKERFEEFRKVINAAADWNKIKLVMRKS